MLVFFLCYVVDLRFLATYHHLEQMCVHINNMVLNYIHTYIYLIYDITILKLLLL